MQLYLQRPELRVHAPEALLRSMGATASSICKVSGALTASVASEVAPRQDTEGHVSSGLKAKQDSAVSRGPVCQPCASGRMEALGGGFSPWKSTGCGAETRVFLRPRPSSVRDPARACGAGGEV